MRELLGAAWGAAFGALGPLATLNHYLVHWPRLRVAGGLVLGGVLLAVAAWLLVRRFWRGGPHRLARALERRSGTPGLVFAGTLLALIASGGGHLYTPDEWTMYAAAAGLVNHGIPAAFSEEPYPLHHVSGPVRIDPATGQPAWVYSKYGVVQSLLAAPLYAVARLTGPGPELPPQAYPYGNRALPLVPLLLNPLLTAGSAALLGAVALQLGYRRGAALVAAGAFVFGSLAWPYSKTLLNAPPAAFALVLAVWALVRAEVTVRGALAPAVRGSERRWLAPAGAALGLAISTRYELALIAAPILAWGLLAHVRPFALRRSAAAFLVGLLPVLVVLVLGMNWIKTGSPFDAGYGGEGGLSTLAAKPWYGWFGQLFSPGCGLATHTPLMAVGLVGLIWLWEDAPRPALAVGGVALLALAYYGSLSTWCGYTAWGPRYLVTIGPFLALPLAAVWQRVSGGRNPFLWLVGGALFIWSAATNALAVVIDWNRGWQDTWANDR
ncbi:MAG TPA: phospholipid carrier-dependent glycosyltransferase, partial [Chloroflexota bacterium]|nr:phospholipid carrier-dependent glycosyltransferase [Chloroflexota bacterium]